MNIAEELGKDFMDKYVWKYLISERADKSKFKKKGFLYYCARLDEWFSSMDKAFHLSESRKPWIWMIDTKSLLFYFIRDIDCANSFERKLMIERSNRKYSYSDRFHLETFKMFNEVRKVSRK